MFSVALVQVFILLGLLHRDISPKNIILLPNYDTPEYKAYEIALNSGDEKAIEQSMIFMVFKAMLIDWELMILANKDSPREYVMTVSESLFPLSNSTLLTSWVRVPGNIWRRTSSS